MPKSNSGSSPIASSSLVWPGSTERWPTMQCSSALGSSFHSTAAAAVQAKPSSTTGVRASRAAITAPAIAASSSPPSAASRSSGSPASRCRATPSRMTRVLVSSALPATPVPRPTQSSASPPNSAQASAAAAVVLPMPISPRHSTSRFGSTAIIP